MTELEAPDSPPPMGVLKRDTQESIPHEEILKLVNAPTHWMPGKTPTC